MPQFEGKYHVEEQNQYGGVRGEVFREWCKVERIKRGIFRYDKIRSLDKD
jgi:hypothetical protein